MMTGGIGHFCLLVRVDASSIIGLGHASRCMALAQQAKQRGWKTAFVMADGCPIELQNQIKGVAELVLLPKNCRLGSSSDAQFTLSQIDTKNTMLVLDGYHFSPDYQKALYLGTHKLLVLDDYQHLPFYTASIISCPSPLATPQSFKNSCASELLLGTPYALLKDDFHRFRTHSSLRFSPVVKKVVITLGGAASGELWLRIVLKLLSHLDEGVEIVLLGPSEAAIHTISKGATSPFLKIVKYTSNAVQIMASADCAITGGGLSAWEFSALGVPFIVVSLAENQRRISEWMHERIGLWIDGESPGMETALAAALDPLLHDSLLREKLARTAWNTIDALGASRVIDACEKHLS